MRIIDTEHHWLPQVIFDKVEKYLGPDEQAIRGTEGIEVRRGGLRDVFSIRARYPDLDLHVKEMDEVGVPQALLSTGLWPEWLNMETARFINDSLAEIQKRFPGRFFGLAEVPPLDPAAPAELERAITVLGLKGVQMLTHVKGKYMDSKEYFPFYQKAEALDIPILVHAAPLLPDCPPIMKDYGLFRALGRQVDRTLASIRPVYSGVLDRFPRLKFIITHLGGFFFVLLNSFTATDFFRVGKKFSFDDYKDRLYFNTAAANWGPSVIKCAYEMLGEDSLLFGSDYPCSPVNFRKGVAQIENAGLPQRAREKVFYENAARLFKI